MKVARETYESLQKNNVLLFLATNPHDQLDVMKLTAKQLNRAIRKAENNKCK